MGEIMLPTKSMPIKEVINRIIKLNEGLRQFWRKADGWAPVEAAKLLSQSRLDWQVSLSNCLNRWRSISKNDEGALILAWANLGALVEGSMKLFLSVYYKDYQKDIDAFKDKKKSKLIDPDILELERLRVFFSKKKIWRQGESWDKWILHIQQRRNAIHAYKHREIGSKKEFLEDVRKYYQFLKFINNSLPYPDDIYDPSV
jgi:hypothetical protein